MLTVVPLPYPGDCLPGDRRVRAGQTLTMTLQFVGMCALHNSYRCPAGWTFKGLVGLILSKNTYDRNPFRSGGEKHCRLQLSVCLPPSPPLCAHMLCVTLVARKLQLRVALVSPVPVLCH